ncbi:MAG: flippase [Patescibacteria group bacterium]|jgi:O-antigen/teichoic acid export membrane protein
MSNRNLAKNTFFYSASLAAQKALSFLYFIILARSVGVADQGRFTFALSFTSIFAMFLDLGLTQVLIREVAKDREHSAKYLANILGYKLAASALVYLIIIVLVNILGYPQLTKSLVYISGFVMLLDSFSLSVYGALRGHQNLAYESLGVIINQSIVLIAGGGLLFFGAPLTWVMAVYILGSLTNFIWSAVNLRRKYQIPIAFSFDWLTIRQLVLISIPFALAGIFNRIFSAIDIVLLSKLANDYAVGIYSVAFKVAFALQFIALAFSASIYPAFANYFAHSQEKLSKLFVKSMYWLMFFSLPISIGVISIADKIIGPVFGNHYAASVLPLDILMLSLVFVFLCFPIGAMLNACDRQARNTIHLGVVAGFSFVANLILIPIWSYNGSAIANIASYALLFVLGITVVGQIIKYDWKFLIWSAAKMLLACLIMYLAVRLLKERVHFIVAIAGGIVTYLILAYILGLFRLRSFKELMKDFKGGINKEESQL